ncbi:MAG: cytochrome c biogenesis protein CcdA [Victivallaceae bacterium]|nr:cytochrome c biogenesis protein CcdA [Victivallaceae bacterium]
MLEYTINALQEAASQPMGLLFALLLGAVSAATSACCTIPALGILVGYSGAQANDDRKAALKSTLCFTAGTIISLMAVGAVAGFIGQAAQSGLGRYWQLFAGIIAIFLGLATLNLLPFKISFDKLKGLGGKWEKSGTILTGLVLGGIVAVSSLPCNPGIFIVIGAAILQGEIFWAMLMLAMFAIGFSIPLGCVMLGISIGRVSIAAEGADTAIRVIAGLILLTAGFYFLIKF